MLVAYVGELSSAQFDVEVLLTNLILTLLIVLLFGTTSSLFNGALDDNREDIERWVGHLGFVTAAKAASARVSSTSARLSSAATRSRAAPAFPGLSRRLRRVASIAVVLVPTGLIYSFLSPDFALDERSLLLFASLVIGLGLVSYMSEGSAVLTARRRLAATGSIKIYGAAIIVAVVCVVFSRAIDFRPGILYGFIASSVIIAPMALSRRQSAQLVVIPALALLAASIAAFVLLLPLRPAAEADGGWLLILLDSVLAMVFIAGMEGLLFSMIPLSFLDGAVVLQWSKVAWALLFGTAIFLYWTLLVEQDKSYLAAFEESSVRTTLLLLVPYTVVTVGLWAFFKARSNGTKEAHEQ